MKAKDLIKLLKENPEAEIIIPTYTGCLTEHLTLQKTNLISSGNKVPCFEATNCGYVGRDGVVKKNALFILST
jgi:hypothetical protein